MPHDGGGAGGCQGTLARKGDAGSEKGDAAPEPAATFGNSRKALAIPPLPFLPFRPKRMVTRVPRVVFVKAVVQIHSHTSGGRNCCELGSSLSSGKLSASSSGDFLLATFGFKRATRAHTPGCVYFLDTLG